MSARAWASAQVRLAACRDRRKPPIRRWCASALLLCSLVSVAPVACPQPQVPLAAEFAREVDRRIEVAPRELDRWWQLLQHALATAGLAGLTSQFVLMVDRAPRAQTAVLWWLPEAAGEQPALLVGASPVSTGRPRGFEHFETPIGVFEHSLDNLDFRAEGTFNEFGIRGYGERGMRVFDFGWQQARRGWGRPGFSTMRLQLHATDPDRLEPKLGTPQSMGCIRVAASFNRFLDRHAILDADYDAALARGETLWVLSPKRMPTPWSGRYLVVVDSENDRP